MLWGTDSIWYGSPQDQIQAFRAFEISSEFQERYGYPALTHERKAKILGLNAARVYGIEPKTTRCEFTRRDLEEIRRQIGAKHATTGPGTPPRSSGSAPTTRDGRGEAGASGGSGDRERQRTQHQPLIRGKGG